MNKYYILESHEVKQDDLMTGAMCFEKQERHVGDETIGDSRISTVFLGLDHSLGNCPPSLGNGLPLLFETLVFNGPLDDEMVRYSTWEEAVAGHNAMVERVKAAGV